MIKNQDLLLNFNLPSPFNQLKPCLPPYVQQPNSSLCGYCSSGFLIELLLKNAQEFKFECVAQAYKKFQLRKSQTQVVTNDLGLMVKEIQASVFGYHNKQVYEEWQQNFIYLVMDQNILEPTQASQNGGNILEAYFRLFTDQQHIRQTGFFLHNVGREWGSTWQYLTSTLIDSDKSKPIFEWMMSSLVIQIDSYSNPDQESFHVIGAVIHVPTQRAILLDQMAISDESGDLFLDDFVNGKSQQYNKIFNKQTGFSLKAYNLFELGTFITNFSVWIPMDVIPYATMYLNCQGIKESQELETQSNEEEKEEEEEDGEEQDEQDEIWIPVKDPNQLPSINKYELIQASFQAKKTNVIGNIEETSDGLIVSNPKSQAVGSFSNLLKLGIRPNSKLKSKLKRDFISKYLDRFKSNDIILGIENSQVCTDVFLINKFLEQANRINALISSELGLISQNTVDDLSQEQEQEQEYVEVVIIKQIGDSWKLVFYILSDQDYIQLLQ